MEMAANIALVCPAESGRALFPACGPVPDRLTVAETRRNK
jgi:hypothetical protein